MMRERVFCGVPRHVSLLFGTFCPTCRSSAIFWLRLIDVVAFMLARNYRTATFFHCYMKKIRFLIKTNIFEATCYVRYHPWT